jgi:CheY-like chemotaxis protein
MNNDKINILYVEDDPDIREIVSMALELESSMQLTACEPSEDVLPLLRQQHFDLVILDVMMPVIDGVTLAKRMQAEPQLEQVPFIFMTAKAMPQELAYLKQMGALGVISKPFDALKLAGEVRQLLGRA